MKETANRRGRHTLSIATIGSLGLFALALLAWVLAPSVTAPHPNALGSFSETSALPRSYCPGCTWLNYTVNPADVPLVATSPDGDWVAAATDDREVLVFSTSSALPWPLDTYTVPAGAGITTLAISDSSATGSPLLLLGWAGPVAGDTGLSAWNITSSGVFKGSPAWSWETGEWANTLPAGSQTWVRQATISDDGDVAMVLVGYSFQGRSGSMIDYYANGQNGCGAGALGYCWNYTSSTDVPVGISMSVDGSRAIAAVQGSLPQLVVFDSFGYTATWTAPSGGEMYAGAISGNGVMMYMSTTAGFYIGSAVTGLSNKTLPNSALATPSEISPSYSGQQVLVSSQSPSEASYYNWTATQTWNYPVLNLTFTSPVDNASLAPNNPNYFVVDSQKVVSLDYIYPNGGQWEAATYREVNTTGPLLDLSISANHDTLAIGSGHIVGGNDEFTLVTDGGVPTPPAPSNVILSAVAPSPGDSSASLQVSWIENTVIPITQVFVQVALTTPVDGSSSAGLYQVHLSGNSATISGLSFSTNYTVTLSVQAYGGATTSPSVSFAASTDGAPAVADPFFAEEVAAAALLVVGLLAAFLFLRRGTGPKDLQAATAGAGPAAASYPPYPPAPMPPQGGGGGR